MLRYVQVFHEFLQVHVRAMLDHAALPSVGLGLDLTFEVKTGDSIDMSTKIGIY